MVFQAGRPSIVSELNENSKNGAWNCVNCWKCIEACPEEVDIYSFMMERRQHENIPSQIRDSIDNITNTGCALSLRGIDQIREMHGLQSLRLIGEQKLKTLLECKL